MNKTNKNLFNREMQILLGSLLSLQDTGKYTVQFDFSGHVCSLTVWIYRGKWRKGKTPFFKQGIYTDRSLAEQYDPVGKLDIPQMIAYVVKLTEKAAKQANRKTK